MQLHEKRCVPCEGGMPSLDAATTKTLLGQVSGWQLVSPGAEPPAAPSDAAAKTVNKIAKQFSFADFIAAMAFVDKMAALAEEEGHHPDFCVHYSRVDVTLWTHAVKGLSENDFILASKIDALVS
jgi:4a-hydroxytetrahydrobiopterin dehydratase